MHAASERLTGALLDRITHHVHILEMNAESYRLKQSRSQDDARPNNPPLAPVGPQGPPTRGPPPAARRARRPARGSLLCATGTSYRRSPWCNFTPPRGVRPYVRTGSLGGLDRMPGMLILELYRAQISERGVETS